MSYKLTLGPDNSNVVSVFGNYTITSSHFCPKNNICPWQKNKQTLTEVFVSFHYCVVVVTDLNKSQRWSAVPTETSVNKVIEPDSILLTDDDNVIM